MSKIALYGNIVIDFIHDVNARSIKKEFGGIMNMARILNNTSINGYIHQNEYSELKQYCEKRNIDTNIVTTDKEPTSHATIIIDKAKAHKKSVVNWGACKLYKPKPQRDVDWHHISYLNALPQIDSFFWDDDITSTISADLCDGPLDHDYIVRIAKHIDYLFMSDTEAKALCICNNIAKVATIIHSAKGSSSILSDGSLYSYNHEPRKNVNVLGAGDAFAAYFIDHTLNGSNFEDAIDNAHERVQKWLTY